MRVGVDYARHDVLFFVDGDMFNVTDEHIESLLRPVLRDECDMNIGVRNRGPIRNFFHLQMKVGPVLSGIRVMRRAVWETVPLRYQERFKIEAALNFLLFARRLPAAADRHLRPRAPDQREQARTRSPASTARWEMSREVFLLHLDLYVFEMWRSDVEQEPLPVAEYDLFE